MEVVPVNGNYHRQETLGRILTILSNKSIGSESLAIPDDLASFRKTALFWGLYINTHGELCIIFKNPYLKKMFGMTDYHRLLGRHPLCSKKDHPISPGGGYKSARAVIFHSSVFATDEVPF